MTILKFCPQGIYINRIVPDHPDFPGGNSSANIIRTNSLITYETSTRFKILEDFSIDEGA
jgi:hypothetical protein